MSNMLSRFLIYTTHQRIPIKRKYLSTMVATEQIEQTVDQVKQAEITRDNLDIVKTHRADPNMVEYEAYSHNTASAKEHSLTASVSNKIGFI